MAVAFDALAFTKRLREAGVPEQQGEVQADAIAEIVEEKLATKQDLRELEYRLILRLGAMMAAAVALDAAVVKLI